MFTSIENNPVSYTEIKHKNESTISAQGFGIVLECAPKLRDLPAPSTLQLLKLAHSNVLTGKR